MSEIDWPCVERYFRLSCTHFSAAGRLARAGWPERAESADTGSRSAFLHSLQSGRCFLARGIVDILAAQDDLPDTPANIFIHAASETGSRPAILSDHAVAALDKLEMVRHMHPMLSTKSGDANPDTRISVCAEAAQALSDTLMAELSIFRRDLDRPNEEEP